METDTGTITCLASGKWSSSIACQIKGDTFFSLYLAILYTVPSDKLLNSYITQVQSPGCSAGKVDSILKSGEIFALK